MIPLQGIFTLIACTTYIHAAIHTGSLKFDDIFEQCSKAVLPGHALLLALHIINHTIDAEIKDEKVFYYTYTQLISIKYSLMCTRYISTYITMYVCNIVHM